MRTIQQVISSHSALADLGKRLSSQRALTGQVRSLLPSPLDEQLQAVVVQNRILSLFVSSPVWASRLRYLAPDLLRQLKQQGLIIDQLRTRIVPERGRKRAPQYRDRLQLSAECAEALCQTAAQISDKPLREAMLRLSRHGRNGRS